MQEIDYIITTDKILTRKLVFIFLYLLEGVNMFIEKIKSISNMTDISKLNTIYILAYIGEIITVLILLSLYFIIWYQGYNNSLYNVIVYIGLSIPASIFCLMTNNHFRKYQKDILERYKELKK